MNLRLILIAISMCFFGMSNAQKIKINDNVATVDGKPFVKWGKVNSMESTIASLNSEEEEIAARWMNYPDPAHVSEANPKGLVRWIELYFPTLDLRCEVSNSTRKELIKLFIRHNIFVEGELNAENVAKMVKRYGMSFSENRPNNNVKVIINNN